jgi:hypothetical protein
MGRFWSDVLWTEMEAPMVQFSQVSGEFAEFFFGCIGHFNPFPRYRRSSGYRKELRRDARPSREIRRSEVLRNTFFWSMTMSPSDPISSSLSLKKLLPISSEAG